MVHTNTHAHPHLNTCGHTRMLTPILRIRALQGAGEMTVRKELAEQLEDLSSDPSTHVKLSGAAYVYILSPGRASGACRPAESVSSKFKALPQKPQWRGVEGDALCHCLASVCTHIIHTYDRTCAHTHIPVLSSGFDEHSVPTGPCRYFQAPECSGQELALWKDPSCCSSILNIRPGSCISEFSAGRDGYSCLLPSGHPVFMELLRM